MDETYTYKQFIEQLIQEVGNWANGDDDVAFSEFIDNLDLVQNMEIHLQGADLKNGKAVLRPLKGMVAGMLKKNRTRMDAAESAIGMLESKLKKGNTKKKKKPQKPSVSIDDAANAFNDLCRLDAIYDLLTGRLHRLDPVIGDFGCQWRVPFVLDLYDHARTQILQTIFDGDEDALNGVLDAYDAYRGAFISYADLLDLFDDPARNSKGGFTDQAVQDFVTSVSRFTKSLGDECAAFAEIEQWFANNLQNWDALGDTFDGYRYLFLCKLFTINRIRHMDAFGLSGIQISCAVPHSKGMLGDLIEEMAKYSMTYMTRVAQVVCTDSGYEIHEETGLAVLDNDEPVPVWASCSDLMQTGQYITNFNGRDYRTHVFYGPFRSIFMYQFLKRQPIIVDVRRVICRANSDGNPEDGTDFSYELNGGTILYFTPDPETGAFVHVANPTSEQMHTVGMCVEAFSVLNVSADPVVAEEDEDRAFYTEDFDQYVDLLTGTCGIFDLIMMGAACHNETPDVRVYVGGDEDMPLNSVREYNEQVERNYTHSVRGRSLYDGITMDWPLACGPVPFMNDAETPDWDILVERNTFRSVAGKFHLTSLEYKSYNNGRETANRTTATIPFAPIHIYGCTYAIKLAELDALLADADEEGIRSYRLISLDNCMRKND